MKTFKSTRGPFSDQPFYTESDFESICSDELSKLDFMPSQPQPIRIDRFVERRFIAPTYEDLGEGILGLSKFSVEGVLEIIVSEQLDAEGGKVSERRVRTTLAHEAGHCLLHTHLFAREFSKQPLFADYTDPNKPKVLCREKVSGAHYAGDWWEVQANKAMACLLLPKCLVEIAIEPHLTARGLLGLKSLEQVNRGQAERELAEVFDVNPVVVRYRVDQLYPAVADGQLLL
jgi:hypothetical protein